MQHSLALSEFRANTAATIALVERGATVRLLRHGKPVADLVPVAPLECPDSKAGTNEPFAPLMDLPGGRSVLRAWLAGDDASW